MWWRSFKGWIQNYFSKRKGLTHALEFPRNFKIECIKVVLSWTHDMKFWLHNGPFEITKKMIHKVTDYPTLDKKKIMRSLSHKEVEYNISAKWNGWGFSITNTSNPLIKFAMRIISHKFYQSRRLNNVPCMAVDQAWKIVMKDHEYDLAELKRLQLVENLTTAKRENNSMCKFISLIMCIFFYI